MQNAIHLTLFIAYSFSHVAASFSFYTEHMDFCIICPKRINKVSFYFISNSSRHRNSPQSSSSASESQSWSSFHLIFWTQHQQQMLPTVGLSLVFILCPLCHFVFLLLLHRNSLVVAALSVVPPCSSFYIPYSWLRTMSEIGFAQLLCCCCEWELWLNGSVVDADYDVVYLRSAEETATEIVRMGWRFCFRLWEFGDGFCEALSTRTGAFLKNAIQPPVKKKNPCTHPLFKIILATFSWI